MKEFFARLNPMERRFVVGVGVLFFLVANLVWVWPHFGDWGQTRDRMNTASQKLVMFQQGIAKIPALRREIEKYQKQGDVVPAEDQAVQFVRLIQKQAAQSGVIIASMGSQRQSSSTNNPFFVEQNETIRLQSGEKQLVDFLYNLGAGGSLIRVKVLSVQPDQSHQQLASGVTLIASYQKKAPAPRAAAAPAARPAAAPATAPPTAAPAAKAPATAVPKPPTNPAVRLPPLGQKPLTPTKK